MKKLFVMLAAILFCGATMVSCSKDDTTTYPTKADMVGTWEGSFSSNTADNNYIINWTLVLNPEGSSAVDSLSFNAIYNNIQHTSAQVPVIDYYTLPNTHTGRIKLDVDANYGPMDEIIDFDIDLSAKTLKGNLKAHIMDIYMNNVTIGGATTLSKK